MSRGASAPLYYLGSDRREPPFPRRNNPIAVSGLASRRAKFHRGHRSRFRMSGQQSAGGFQRMAGDSQILGQKIARTKRDDAQRELIPALGFYQGLQDSVHRTNAAPHNKICRLIAHETLNQVPDRS